MARTKLSFAETLSHSTKYFQYLGLQYFSVSDESDGYQTDEVSKKFKFIFACFIIILLCPIAALVYIIVLEKATEKGDVESGLKYLRILLLFFIEISIIHAFVTTPRAKDFFKKCKKANKYFADDLGFDIDYDGFSANFNRIVIKSSFIFWTLSLILLVSIFTLSSISQGVIATVYVIIPYFFMKMFYLKFVFFVLLVQHNIRGVKKVLVRLASEINCTNFHIKPVKQNKSEEIFKTIISLKTIYGLLFEMTELANSLSGPSLLMQLCMTIIVNTSALFKLYLAANGEFPVEQLGSKLFHFNSESPFFVESWEGSNEFLRLFLEGFRFYEENGCSFID